MRLSWMEPGGSLRSLLAEPGSRHEIKVRRGSPQAIVALPISSGRSLCPAGALYPEGLAGRKAGEGMDELSLDWRGGYAASLFAALEGGGVDPCGFDLYALVDQAIARSSDPWLLAPLEVARRLTASGFRIDAFKKPKLMAVDLVPGRSWAPESPFAAAPVPLRSAAAEIAQLPEGLWRFVGEDSELFVSVDSSGRATFVRR
jgi:hypothetical protein